MAERPRDIVQPQLPTGVDVVSVAIAGTEQIDDKCPEPTPKKGFCLERHHAAAPIHFLVERRNEEYVAAGRRRCVVYGEDASGRGIEKVRLGCERTGARLIARVQWSPVGVVVTRARRRAMANVAI